MVWNYLPGVLSAATRAVAGVGPEASYKHTFRFSFIKILKTTSVEKQKKNTKNYCVFPPPQK